VGYRIIEEEEEQKRRAKRGFFCANSDIVGTAGHCYRVES
jgi:hypothetical protein